MMIDLLFIYGTLLDDDNEFAIYLKNNSSFYAEGRINGLIYDLGEYPGAVLSASDDEYVHGVIFKLNDPEKVLEIVDDYEGYGEYQEQPNLFVRVLVEAETEKGRVKCWVYEYNVAVEGFRQIISGRYIKQKTSRS